MISFLKKKKASNIFKIENDMCFLYVLDDNNLIDLQILLTGLYAIIEKYDKIVISIDSEMNETEKFKIVLCKNLSSKISYLMS